MKRKSPITIPIVVQITPRLLAAVEGSIGRRLSPGCKVMVVPPFSDADRVVDAGHSMYHGAIVTKLERELAEAQKQVAGARCCLTAIQEAKEQRDRLAEAFTHFSVAYKVSQKIDERYGRPPQKHTPEEAWERCDNQQRMMWDTAAKQTLAAVKGEPTP